MVLFLVSYPHLESILELSQTSCQKYGFIAFKKKKKKGNTEVLKGLKYSQIKRLFYHKAALYETKAFKTTF